MTSLKKKNRALIAVGTSALLVASAFGATAANAAGLYDDKIILSDGHADMFYVEKDDAGQPKLLIHSDEFGNYPAEDFVIHGKPSKASRTAGAAVSTFLGIDNGATYYLLPQNNRQGELFLGFGYNTNDYPANSLDISYEISNLDGPGTVALWQNSEDGPQAFLFPEKGVNSFTSQANHEHVNWGFTEQGTYTFDITASVNQGGTVIGTPSASYTIVIGEELPEAPIGDVETDLSITGLGAHYHTGNVATLTAVQSPEEVSDHYHWFTRPDANSEWKIVPGVTGEKYGFVVTAQQQVKAVLYDHDHKVITESEPANIVIDDHGNTPISGPELNVELARQEGALVLSIADAAKSVELSALELNQAADRFVSTGSVTGITVTDTRAESNGWTVNGRVRDLVTNSGAVLNGKYLGWAPRVDSASAGQQVSPGAAVTPGLLEGNGIKGWSTLGSASNNARGTSVLGADIRIEAPTTTEIGKYQGVLLITVI